MIPLQHNIVSMLYTIKGFSESHLERVDEKTFEDVCDRLLHAERMLLHIEQQAQKALTVTKCLGQVLKEQSRKLNGLERVSVPEVWHEILDRLEKEEVLQGVEIINRIPKDLPLIQCEKESFFQIGYLIASNAIDSMKGCGKLVLRIHLACDEQNKKKMVIMISDTGSGIAEDRLGCLFQPYYSTKGLQKGNGLGLYLARSLVTKNKGHIQVTSYPDQGTTLFLEFPVAT